MPLNNTQHDELMRRYNRIQLDNIRTADARRTEVYECFPELSDIDNSLFEYRNKLFHAFLSEDNDAASIHKKIDDLQKEKQAIISSRFPRDYLEPVYTCATCKDTGYVNNRHCTCFKKAAIDLLYAQSNRKNIDTTHTFKNFDYSLYSKEKFTPEGKSCYHNIVDITNICKDFVKNFDTMHQSLFITGIAGVGKTYLTDCIFNELISSLHSVIYLTSVEFFTLLENAKFDNGVRTQVQDSLYDSLLDCDLLIIDDLGTEMVTPFSLSNLFYYINDRLLRNRSTIITSNLSTNKLREIYSDRISSRIAGEYINLEIYGKDLRNS